MHIHENLMVYQGHLLMKIFLSIMFLDKLIHSLGSNINMIHDFSNCGTNLEAALVKFNYFILMKNTSGFLSIV